ncbi:hypothetical protein KY363_07110, partial [Candidatus Woesearchaeota archaeon]|nr:hypothetical protein [Candidatus Woesearchaeota archaeon]
MNRRTSGSGRRTEDLNTQRKVLCIVLLAFLFMTVSATFVDAAAMDRVKKTWGEVRHYALAPAFWVNALIIFGVLFVLYSLLLAQKMGSDSSQKVILYILIAIIAMIIATKIVAANGVPQYMWKNTQFSKATQFLIGPTNPRNSCGGGVPSQVKAILNWDPNPPCCGTGAYETTEKGKLVC